MHGGSIRQRIRCIGDCTLYGKPPRRDWVWCRVGAEPVTACSPLPYKAPQVPLPRRLLRLFKVIVPSGCSAAGQTFWLAFVELTRVVNSGMREAVSQVVCMTSHLSGVDYAVLKASRITGAAHLIPLESVSAAVLPGVWTVSSNISLATWNDVYWMDDEDIAKASAV
jgi:hypothetical protein